MYVHICHGGIDTPARATYYHFCSYTQVTVKVQTFGMQAYLQKFEKSIKRIKNRAACRPSVDAWRAYWYRTALFTFSVESGLMLSSKIDDAEVKRKYQMYQEGDFDDEFDSYLITMMDDFSYEKTSLYDPVRATGAALVNMDGVMNDAQLAAEHAQEALYDESVKKAKVDVLSWTRFMAQMKDDQKLDEVAHVMHQRAQQLKGCNLADKFMEANVSLFYSTDLETIKTTANLAANTSINKTLKHIWGRWQRWWCWCWCWTGSVLLLKRHLWHGRWWWWLLVGGMGSVGGGGGNDNNNMNDGGGGALGRGGGGCGVGGGGGGGGGGVGVGGGGCVSRGNGWWSSLSSLFWCCQWQSWRWWWWCLLMVVAVVAIGAVTVAGPWWRWWLRLGARVVDVACGGWTGVVDSVCSVDGNRWLLGE